MKRASFSIILIVGVFAAVLAVPARPARSSPAEFTLVTDPSTCPGCRRLETLLLNAGWTRDPVGFRKGDVLLRTVASHPDSRALPSLLENGKVSAVGAGEVRDRAETLARATPPAFPATPNELLQQFVPAQERPSTADRLSGIFRQATDLGGALERLIQGAARAVGSLLQGLGPAPGAGAVSRFTPPPDPKSTGYGPRARYRAPTEGGPTSFPGINSDPSRLHQRGFSDEPKPNVTDVPGRTQVKCGGKPGDPFWREDCRCRCSVGAAPGVRYQAPPWCPEFPLFPIPCEHPACPLEIRRHDNYVTTIAECLRQSPGHPEGGRPTNLGIHGL